MPSVREIYAAYARRDWSVEVLAIAFGVSPRHIHWAIDEARRRHRKLRVVNG